MTLEEFRATRRWSEDIRKDIADDWTDQPIPGMVYYGACHVFAHGDESWLLVIGNWQQVGDLESLESELYAWAKAEFDL